jgi:hypothetical protein
MKKTGRFEEQQRLQETMRSTFKNEIKTLNPELQSILIDDIVTAFHNRLTVLKKIQIKTAKEQY